MNTKRILCAALGAVCYFAFLQAQVRTEQTFEKGWKFTREDNAEFANSGYNDSKWQNVTVPHDWAIYGPFSINNDKQEMAITQDGQTEAMEHAGRICCTWASQAGSASCSRGTRVRRAPMPPFSLPPSSCPVSSSCLSCLSSSSRGSFRTMFAAILACASMRSSKPPRTAALARRPLPRGFHVTRREV